jgi:hypothetical protein
MCVCCVHDDNHDTGQQHEYPVGVLCVVKLARLEPRTLRLQPLLRVTATMTTA